MDKKNKIKKQEILRNVVQAAFLAVTNGYITGFISGKIFTGDTKRVCVPGLNCYSCPGALGACPIGSLQATLDSGKFKYVTYALSFIIAFGLFLGRFICGWLCPFGLIQDLIYKVPFFKKIKNLPGHKYLKYIKYVLLVALVIILPLSIVNSSGIGKPWFCAYICPSGTLLAGIPLVLSNPELSAALGWLFDLKISILLGIIVLALFCYRPFCKYLCPLGAIYGFFNPISINKMNVDKNLCTKCGRCQKACLIDIKVWENPNSLECIRCGKCKSSCPNMAITSGIDKFKNGLNSLTHTKTQNKNFRYLNNKSRIIVGIASCIIAIAAGVFLWNINKPENITGLTYSLDSNIASKGFVVTELPLTDDKSGTVLSASYKKSSDAVFGIVCAVKNSEADEFESYGGTRIGSYGNYTYFTRMKTTQYKNAINNFYSLEDKKIADECFAYTQQWFDSIKIVGEPKIDAKNSIPSFDAIDLDGNEISKDVFASHDFTVLNVWATFCSDCIGEMPQLIEWKNKMPDNVQIIGLVGDAEGTDDTTHIDLAKKIYESNHINFPSIVPSKELKDALNIQIFPTTFIVDKNGHIVGNPILDANVEGYKKAIDEALSTLK